MTSINDPGHTDEQIEKIKEFLQALLTSSGLSLEFKILACNGQVQTEVQTPAQTETQPPAPSPEISVEFTGPDTPLLTARNAELLHSIEHLAAKVLRFEPDQHDRISFDAENFKALRNAELELIAQTGAERVRATNRSYAFPPMNSRERRLLHLALAASGLPTASSSDGPRRFVVAYPEGQQPIEPERPSTNDRTHAIRKTFRRR
ncbi:MULTISPECIES: R3H domain-containing nucleic acid-binding protein [Acidobacteriaceae]|uniref:Jag family protein n=1 Tax=Acidobacteriaceae TaxID=204434 RepID=UPI00131ABE9D|nr:MULTISPECIES: R3H domain-containing nucleic acid-binding protein [Acidobacteriaceae]MDW5265636.1 R3H domain-containing nucleic acid-binding protein [Edaphobacter sp.]